MSVKEINKTKVREFFRALEEGKALDIAMLFSENGEQMNPYHSNMFPAYVKGRQAIEAYWAAPIENFEGMKFHMNSLYAMEDPRIIFVDFKGEIFLGGEKGVYSNDYYAIFEFNQNNEIEKYVEIFNPIVAAKGFGLEIKE